MNKNVIIGVCAVLGVLIVAPVLIKALSGPPDLNEQSLTNTVWEVEVNNWPTQVELQPGGKMVAPVPAEAQPLLQQFGLSLERIEGTWAVNSEAKTLTITASIELMGQTQTRSTTCQIKGQHLFLDEKEVKRIR